ncbi:hypothetical protein [Natrarchaeobius chitinivorans]|uniref:Uncharacterized protein n=1 Tax=Natrarchaeobius chitinivorans TaxID=1679083 RepID=A0A3N6N5M5_NATCH|nr:hypothetical protein [Natrarchaeobius chitinivorans]RQG93592.1 hypothetical protein EA473_14795 [Natrarchaeobius chitinivorans]
MYEQTFDTDWQTIDDPEEVVRRAFALGVAARLGRTYPGELERLGEQTGSNYDRSFVDLAFQKGRNEAREIRQQVDDDDEVWDSLVEGKTVVEPPAESSDAEFDDTDGDDVFEDGTVPGALRRVDIDTLPDDSTDRVGQPSFLDRLGGNGPTAGPDSDRTVFGRPVDGSRGDRDESDRAENDTSPEDEVTETSSGGDNSTNGENERISDGNQRPDDEDSSDSR